MPQVQHGIRHYASESSPSSSGGISRWIKYPGYAILASMGAFAVVRAFVPNPNAIDNAEKAEAAFREAATSGPLRPSSSAASSSDATTTTPTEKGQLGANKVFKGGEQGWLDLKLESTENLSHNTKKLRFALPGKDDVSGLSVAYARGYLDFVVKKYPNGPMSSHMHDMEPPQRLDFKGPIPKYQWEPNKHDHIALIAGGTGITPMYQLCRAIFSNPLDKTKVSLVFGNVSESDILLKHELQDLENTYPQRFKAFYMLDNPPDGWPEASTGYISKQLLKTVLPEPKEGGRVKIFVCGPPGLYKAISGGKKSPQDQGELAGTLKELGYSKDQVYKF
ncbi:MAG: hypothetical protein Q9220_005243 [cf. Caloplaca sp. 1 TL-2023]